MKTLAKSILNLFQIGKVNNMAAYKEQYYSLKEEEMQTLLAKAKSGSSFAQEELLKIFSNFLTKYVTMLFIRKV